MTQICHNIRLDDFNKVYRQVGRPYCINTVFEDIHSGRAYVLSDYVSLPGNSFVKKNSILYAFLAGDRRIMVAWKNSCYILDEYPVPPVAIVASGDDLFVLLSDGYPPRRYTFVNRRWVANQEVASLPAPYCLARTDASSYSAVIPSISLKGEYNSRSTQLTVADAKTLGKAMGDAYVTLADRAMSERNYIQPVMARYRIRGKSGDILYTSAPVLVTPAKPLQCADARFTLGGGSFNVTSETSLTAQGFNLSLTPLSPLDDLDGWVRIISSVEILVSPQLHPYMPEVSPSHSFGAFSTSSGSLTVRLPGVENSQFVAHDGSSLNARVASMLARVDDCLHPYEAERHDTLSEISSLRRQLAATVGEADADSRLMADFCPPHSFSAGCAASGGDMLLWGDLEAKRFAGYSLAELAAAIDLTAGAAPAASVVRFSDGSSVVNSATLLHPPLSLSPLITYPHPDAVEMELRCGSRSVTLPLTPAPGGRWSYYLSPSALPVGFDTDIGGFVLPTADPPQIRHPDAIAVSSAASPFTLRAVSRCGGRVTALTSTALPVSSWDFARANFYAFTESGINAVTVNSRRDSVTSARIDSRCVESADAVALTPEGVMAVASGDLVRLNSNRVVTLLSSLGADRVGWSQPFGELWCVTDGNPEILVVNAKGERLHTRDDVEVRSMHTSPFGLFATTASGEFVELSREEDARSTVRFQAQVKLRSVARKLLRLVLPVYGDDLKGSIEVVASFGPALSRTLARFAVDGSPDHPFTTIIPSPARSTYTVSITLTGTAITIAAL